jgi:hypothetical protein
MGHLVHGQYQSMNKPRIRSSYGHQITDFEPVYLGYSSFFWLKSVIERFLHSFNVIE